MVENLAQLSLDKTTKLKKFESPIQVASAQGRVLWFAIIATSACKKDQWKKNISWLFSKFILKKKLVDYFCPNPTI